MTTWVYDRTDDVLDEIDVGSSIVEIASEIIGLLAFKDAKVEDIIGLIGSVMTLGTAAFRANMGISDVEDLACEGHCLMLDANSWDMNATVLQTWLDTAGPSDLVYDPGQWLMMRVANTLSKSDLMQRYILGLNNPESDWSILCDCALLESTVRFDTSRTAYSDNDFSIVIDYQAAGTIAHIRATNNGGELYRGFDLELWLEQDGPFEGIIQLRSYGMLPNEEWNSTQHLPGTCETAVEWIFVYDAGEGTRYAGPSVCETVDDNHIIYTYNLPANSVFLRLEEPYDNNCRYNPDHGFPTGATAEFYIQIIPPAP